MVVGLVVTLVLALVVAAICAYEWLQRPKGDPSRSADNSAPGWGGAGAAD